MEDSFGHHHDHTVLINKDVYSVDFGQGSNSPEIRYIAMYFSTH